MKKVLSIILCVVIAVSCVSFSVNAKTVKVTAPKMKSVTNTDIDAQKIKWTKVRGVKGYQLYCKAGTGSYKKIKTLGKNTTSFTNKKLKAGTKYFYKIKAYKKTNGKTKYSKFSNQLGKKCTNYLVDLYKPYQEISYYECKNGITFNMGGEKYGNGFYISSWLSYKGDAIFNLKGKYKKITMTIGNIDGEREDGLFTILSDDYEIESYAIKANSLPRYISINIDYANKLEIRKNSFADIGFANVKLYK